ncbi:MAG: UDP-glucose/GDP-mannose dehydrogenase family protein [Bacteroidota bacterium]|nr:UDP-glucose/GDP-mannose dehydrogenase family protein [Bacteroidota bacterium]
MNIAVIGTGYVGLVTGTCFAETGNMVTCVDIDEEKVKTLSSGKVTIYEPGLEKIFERNQKEGRLRFTTSLSEGIWEARIVFLALPTPQGEDGSADLQYVLSVAENIGKFLRPDDYKVIVDKSTVPVGTAERVRDTILGLLKSRNLEHPENLFDVVSNPEFLREGVAVEDFMKPNRVIIGTSTERPRKILGQLYAPFVRQGNPIIYMDERSAELTKYAANAFLATKISFMNEIAQLCEKLNADVDMVRKGMGSDDRIGRRFLFSGIGYGGSCFPKDVKALTKSAQGVNYDFKILEAVLDVNEIQKQHLVPKVLSYFGGKLEGKTVALWGLAFKPNTDDIREAPALRIIEALEQSGAQVCAYDPEAMGNVQKQMGDRIRYADNQYDALDGADALVIATEWSEFRTPDFNRMKSLMKNCAIFDGRNLFELAQMEEIGFHYESIGRKAVRN